MLQRSRGGLGSLKAAGVGLLLACSAPPTGVEVQVIEDVDFAPSLGIELGRMTRLSTGVYVEDVILGSGAPAAIGTTPTVTCEGWLTDGTSIGQGTFSFPMGNGKVVRGFEDGLIGARPGGRRRIVVPPNRGYGGVSVGVIPAGSVLVYDVVLERVADGAPSGAGGEVLC